MNSLNVTKRELSGNGKKLRREGIVPGNIFGKNLEEAVSIQVSSHDLQGLLKKNSVGSQVEVLVGKENYLTMIKEVRYQHLGKGIEHIDFQVLTKGEKAKVSVSVNFINRDLVETGAIIQEMFKEIEYEALPVDMIDHIDVDLTNLQAGDSVKISDLPIASDDRYNILTPIDSTLVVITNAKFTEEVAEDDDADTGIVAPLE